MSTSSSGTTGSSSGGGGSNPATLLQCPHCNSPYDQSDHEAKLLSCHHSACLACVRELAAGGRTAFRCPECRHKTSVPKNGGVAALATNFYVTQMRDVVVYSPESPTNDVVTATTKSKAKSGGSSSATTELKMNTACQKHLNQPLLFFCETCMVAICMNCTVLDHDKNAGHRINDIGSVLRQHNDILTKKMGQMDKATDTFNTGLKLLKRELSNLETTRETASKHIEETFKQLAIKLEQRRDEMLKAVQDVYLERKEGVVTQAQVFKRQAEKVSTMREKCEAIVGSENAIEPIQAATNLDLMAKIDELCQTPTNFTVSRHSYIQFQYEHGLQKFVDSMAKLGKIDCDQALPTVIKYDVPDCVAGIKTTIKVHVKSIKGEPVSKCPLTVKITDPEDDELQGKFNETADGVYTVDVRPQIAGRHRVSLHFLDYPIWGQETEFEVQSNDPVLTLPLPDDQTELNRPTSVAICEANGNIYVADMGKKRIVIFNAAGKLLAQFKIGSNKATAYDVKINAAAEELVCSKVGVGEAGQTLGNTITIFSLTGERKQQFTNGELRKALFLAVNSKGQIIVTDSSLNALIIHSKEGMALKKVGGQGQGQGQFNFPSSVCIGKDDMILVSDTGNNRVQIFSKTGKFLHEFGAGLDQNHDDDVNKGRLFSPRGIAADDRCILVADGRNRIQMFKYDGTFLGSIQSLGEPIQEPYNMALTADGHVLVADFKNNCVKKFRYK